MNFDSRVIVVSVDVSLYVSGSFVFNMDYCKIESQLFWNVMKFCLKYYSHYGYYIFTHSLFTIIHYLLVGHFTIYNLYVLFLLH
jgi:hypothetical protein